MDLGLKGKVALVTGASAGIGRATAEALANEGARVLAVARRAELLQELEGDSARGEVIPVALDVLQDDAVDRIQAAIHSIGCLDVLVNNVGRSIPVELKADADHTWAEATELNFQFARRLTTQLIEGLCPGASIVNVCGTIEPWSYNAAFPAKAALGAWSKMLATELGPSGIRVNAVSPGRVLTEQILDSIHSTAEERQTFAQRHIPLGHMGDAQSVARLVCFLASNCSQYITGENIRVDGGLHRSAF